MFKVGNIEVKNPVVVAPMAGISNSAFRLTVKEFGAGLVVCEMISDQGIHYRNEKTLSMLHIEPEEWPLSVQIFGGSRESLVEAAKFVEANTQAAIIDINMGCPVNKVIKCEAGAKWLLDPEKVYEMVSAVTDAVAIPVTVKMRTGWDEDHLFAVENARAAERGGAAMVAMHGRTRVQMYDGKANWDILGEVKQHLSIPFVGNGDIKTPEQAKEVIDEYGVDGVMMGRAALGNPWVVQQTVHYLETGELLPPKSIAEKFDIAKLHLDRLVNLKGESTGVREFRGIAAYYLKGVPRAAKTKAAITQANYQGEVHQYLDDLMTFLESKDIAVHA